MNEIKSYLKFFQNLKKILRDRAHFWINVNDLLSETVKPTF